MAKSSMIQIKQLFVAALAVLFLSPVVVAQDAPPMPMEYSGDGPTEVLEVPPPSGSPSPASIPTYDSSQGTQAVSGPEFLEPTAQSYDLWDACPPVTESTGTWLDRGYWYSEIEAVVMTRQWSRGNLNIAGTGIANLGGGITVPSADTPRLIMGRTSPGREGSARFTLGRFLARDSENRDHRVEMTFFGGGEFGLNSSLFSDPNAPNTIQVPSAFDLMSSQSFDGADSMFVQYDSRFNSYEFNYTTSTRLDRDRMELLPNGRWVRRAHPGFTYQGLAGLRYIDLTENFAWTATDIVNNNGVSPTGVDGFYDIRTSNDLFGLQGGGGMTYQAARFNIGGLLKMGIFANDAKARSGLAYTNRSDGTNLAGTGFSNSNRGDTLSWITEFSLVGRYYVQPNITLRTGYHAFYLTEVALAPHQLDFAEDNAKVASTGDPFYHGISAGLDFTW